MRSLGDDAGDLIEVELHGLRVGIRHGQGGTRAAGRADSTEQIRAVVALIGWLARPRASSRPLPHHPVLLANPGLILKPDLDRLTLGNASQVGVQRGREVFLKAATVCPS